ncbi:branched-chain amino acid transport system permease protein [uncultured Gammaproteobacteria bacterium]
MIYREAGQYKTSYAADQAIFPIRQDRIGIALILVVAFGLVPLVGSQYVLSTIMIPFLLYSLAALGLNILTGYAGQLSLGTGGFMACGAFAAYKLTTAFPGLNILIVLFLSGVVAAGVGILFGLPSLRIKGFYLAVATLASQFFLVWLFTKVAWFTNYASSGVVSVPPRAVFGSIFVTGNESTPAIKYLFALSVVSVLALAAKNMTRCSIGRQWMAIRDMDIAAEIIGIRPLHAKLSAFAISSFYCGVAGALWGFIYLGGFEPTAFNIDISFKILFMIIIGGLGSILGSFLGAAFIVVLPIALSNGPAALGLHLSTALVSHLEAMTFGGLILFFLIVEPHGLARLWRIGKEKLRLWPFPY